MKASWPGNAVFLLMKTRPNQTCVEWSLLLAHCALPAYGSTKFYPEFSRKAELIHLGKPLHSNSLHKTTRLSLKDHHLSLQSIHPSLQDQLFDINSETVQQPAEMAAKEDEAANVTLIATELKPNHNG